MSTSVTGDPSSVLPGQVTGPPIRIPHIMLCTAGRGRFCGKTWVANTRQELPEKMAERRRHEENCQGGLIVAAAVTRNEVACSIMRDQLVAVAGEQRQTGDELAALAKRAHEVGMTWRDIGDSLGMLRETVYRQVQAGSPVSVLRPFQTPEGAVKTRTGPFMVVTDTAGNVYLHNSAEPAQGELRFTPGEWDAFVSAVKDGDFDTP